MKCGKPWHSSQLKMRCGILAISNRFCGRFINPGFSKWTEKAYISGTWRKILLNGRIVRPCNQFSNNFHFPALSERFFRSDSDLLVTTLSGKPFGDKKTFISLSSLE